MQEICFITLLITDIFRPKHYKCTKIAVNYPSVGGTTKKYESLNCYW